MTKIISKLLTISLVVVLLSNCGFPGWAKRMGDKLPVYGESKRCTDWLCFGDDKKSKKKAENIQNRRKILNAPKSPKAITPPKKLYAQPSKSQPNNQKYKQNPFLTTDSDYGRNNAGSPPPMPPMGAIPPGAPSRPPTQAESKNIKPWNPDSDDMSFDPNFDPEAFRPENIKMRQENSRKAASQEYKDSGLKQHEIDAKWKDDLPEGPLGEVRKSVDW